MPIKDFQPMAGSIKEDPDSLENWLDSLGLRQNIDLLPSATPVAADSIRFLDRSASQERQAAFSDVLALFNIGSWASWTPTRTGWTDVGTAPVVTANYVRTGNIINFEIKVVPGTTVATTAGTSYVSLPVTAAGLSGDASMVDLTTLIAIGDCVIDVANSRVYVPTKIATGDSLLIAGWYRV